ncbi:hypothetical protein IFO70_29475 [Phormidium tenue FACHB-886]|nr:hypothetical protein [Phormidium tenue FACHB-886]
MGTESGEELAEIIRRKEWERQLGEGYFFWGIGQSLGANAKSAARDKTSICALFSPMHSKPKAIDTIPTQVVLWNAWIDAQGQIRQLPSHCFITSRASLPSGRRKDSHYALVCYSKKELTTQQENISISPDHLRNLTTNKSLGSSQVTAIVRTIGDLNANDKTKSYSVSFTAELRSPFYVQLAQPIILNKDEINDIKSLTALGDVRLWDTLVKHLRSRTLKEIDWVQGTLDLGETNQVLPSDSANSLGHSKAYTVS